MGKIHSLFSQKTQSPIFGRILNMPLRLVLSHHNFKNELLTLNKSSYWIWSFYHSWNTVYRFAPFWANFEFVTSQVQNFLLLLGRDTLLWNYFEEFGKLKSKKGCCFTSSSKYFTKKFKMLVLSNNLSHFSRRLKKSLPRYKKIFDIWHKIFAQFK